MKDLIELTASVCRLAVEIGNFQREERKTFSLERVEKKGVHDYVSYVDKESERRIVEYLTGLLPEAGFIAEEGYGSHHAEPFCWLVDPLDGTTNYIHDNAPYCVSIALSDRQEMLLGVVYEVCRDELFFAWKGGKAFLSTVSDRAEGWPAGSLPAARPITVSRTDSPDQLFIGLGFPYNSRQYKPMAHHLIDQYYGSVGGLRLQGACAAELCYVAAGRFDGRIESFLGPWDIAASSLILRCAGGKITDYQGNDLFYDAKEVVASNGKMHNYLLKTINLLPDTKN